MAYLRRDYGYRVLKDRAEQSAEGSTDELMFTALARLYSTVDDLERDIKEIKRDISSINTRTI